MKFLPTNVASAVCRSNKLGLLIFLIILIFSKASIASAIIKSDILLHIVSQCVDPSKAHYCSSCTLPRVDAQCGQTLECRQTNEVWELSSQYVAIRDIKMCGCPSVVGASYCGEHYWRVYARGTSVNGRRRERAIEQEIQQLKLAQELEEYENEN